MAGPKLEVSCSKSHVEYRFIGGGWLPVLLSYLILAGIFLPYLIVLWRETLNPVLPFVSQAAGSPPQSGVFCIFLFLSSLVAFVGLHLLHMGLMVKSARAEDQPTKKAVELLNKILLLAGHVGIVGIVVVAAYPMDFRRHNEDWMQVTLIPHLIGAISLFVGGIVFCMVFTHIISLLEPQKTKLFRARVFLIGIVLVASALQGYTVSDAFMVEYNSEKRLASCILEKVEYHPRYIVSSLCEWVLLVFFTIFFMTIREEAQHFLFTMSIAIDDCAISAKPNSTKDKIRLLKQDENCNTDDMEEKSKVVHEKS